MIRRKNWGSTVLERSRRSWSTPRLSHMCIFFHSTTILIFIFRVICKQSPRTNLIGISRDISQKTFSILHQSIRLLLLLLNPPIHFTRESAFWHFPPFNFSLIEWKMILLSQTLHHVGDKKSTNQARNRENPFSCWVINFLLLTKIDCVNDDDESIYRARVWLSCW